MFRNIVCKLPRPGEWERVMPESTEAGCRANSQDAFQTFFPFLESI